MSGSKKHSATIGWYPRELKSAPAAPCRYTYNAEDQPTSCTARYTTPDPLGLAPCDESDPTWGGRVQFGELDQHGRATGVSATIAPDMLGGQTNPKPPNEPAGWEKGNGYNRGHLLTAMIGGSNKNQRNFITMHRYANSPVMRALEMEVRNTVRDSGQHIQYSVTPIYNGDDPVPVSVTIEAYDSQGFQFTDKKTGSTFNNISILNIP